MNKEVHYEGWLIKSPPSRRIWRARWRRRWFTLKQGEIPEQFCLEYYTDRNCRKQKGVIDLDQCEQVDCGLRLENRKQKFQFMFDIKTPKRTYYLAADTEADMRDWVNCICQVCHLHDTKQSSEQDDSRTQVTSTISTVLTNSTNNTTTTSLNSSSGPSAKSGALGVSSTRQSFNNDILRHTTTTMTATTATTATTANTNINNLTAVIDQQPLSNATNNSDCSYVNTEYTNRETLLCDMRFDRQQLAAATTTKAMQQQQQQQQQQQATSPSAALYLNSPVAHAHDQSTRLAVNSNGVVRKIPENLVLNNTPLTETQPSPALSTASGPYIPISECFSGSPKFIVDGNNPTTPLNNLDPKFYDTPRSHNNIGLNLTNDQSYSPKITNCSLQQMSASKNRSHRSDSDSESVFTDDDEWAHPLPLRENVDRNTRPSDSSVENESFVLTYSQRFSKLPDEATKEQKLSSTPTDPLDKLAKVLKNKNNLILDFKHNEKISRDLPQLSDTENTSPAIGPRDARSVVDESYDIPRSHQLPYHNMGQLFEKLSSPEVNPIAASTPNLIAGPDVGTNTPASVRTLPRPHCYTNAAPSKIEGNVFRYDFGDLPPVNRQLKPKATIEDKPPEEVPAKPPTTSPQILATQQHTPPTLDNLTNKLMTTNLYSPVVKEGAPLKPPSVDRKSKPIKFGYGTPTQTPTLITAAAAAHVAADPRRSIGIPQPILASTIETRTLPRQLRSNFTGGIVIQHQRTASAAAAVQMTTPPAVTAAQSIGIPTSTAQLQLPPKNEHKLQYFDLDVANPPAINRQSMSIGNLNAPGAIRPSGLAADPSARAPVKSSVVYNSVDFVKTEAFKRIREERKKESESVNSSCNTNSSNK